MPTPSTCRSRTSHSRRARSRRDEKKTKANNLRAQERRAGGRCSRRQGQGGCRARGGRASRWRSSRGGLGRAAGTSRKTGSAKPSASRRAALRSPTRSKDMPTPRPPSVQGRVARARRHRRSGSRRRHGGGERAHLTAQATPRWARVAPRGGRDQGQLRRLAAGGPAPFPRCATVGVLLKAINASDSASGYAYADQAADGADCRHRRIRGQQSMQTLGGTCRASPRAPRPRVRRAASRPACARASTPAWRRPSASDPRRALPRLHRTPRTSTSMGSSSSGSGSSGSSRRTATRRSTARGAATAAAGMGGGSSAARRRAVMLRGKLVPTLEPLPSRPKHEPVGGARLRQRDPSNHGLFAASNGDRRRLARHRQEAATATITRARQGRQDAAAASRVNDGLTFASKANKVDAQPLVQELRLDMKPGPAGGHHRQGQRDRA